MARNSLKLLASGCHEFWRGEEWKWNAFDFCIVWLSVLELGTYAIGFKLEPIGLRALILGFLAQPPPPGLYFKAFTGFSFDSLRT